jgi:putative transposase
MQGLKSPGQAQRFLAAYGPIASHFRSRRHPLPTPVYRQAMARRFQIWREIMGTVMAA